MYLLEAGAQLFPLVKGNDKDVEFEPWKNYTYPSMGEKRPIQMQELPPIVSGDRSPISQLDLKEKKENVKKWLADDTVPDPVEQLDLLTTADELIDHGTVANNTLGKLLSQVDKEKLDILELAKPVIDGHMTKEMKYAKILHSYPKLLAPKSEVEEDLLEFPSARKISHSTVLDDLIHYLVFRLAPPFEPEHRGYF
jgi:hypothetical protein